MAARLSSCDLLALQRAIRELYELRELDGLRRVLPELVLRLIPGDFFMLAEVDLDFQTRKPTTTGMYGEPEFNTEMLARMERSVPDHPFTRQIMEHGPATGMMFSDFFSESQFLRSELYNEYYRLLGIGRSLSNAVIDGGHICSLNALRQIGAREFSERDRLVLTLLQPHFEQARRNAVLYEGRCARHVRPLAAFDLTPRESEVATWLARGKTNGEIALILGASARTVEKHVEKVLEKLGVENRTAAAVMISDGLGI